MTTDTTDNGDVFKLSYCATCDSSPFGGVNPFLESLGELQRNRQVDLTLEKCDMCEGNVWLIKYVTGNSGGNLGD
tara:strand:+ start:376 stop:600 length:225 start_codon:yes stop_codon:yes gene_type:complete